MKNVYYNFLSILHKYGIRVGWTRVININDKDDCFLCIIFHTHIDDGDETENIIMPLLNNFWFFHRFKTNRFLLCSILYYILCIKGKKEISYVKELYPNLGYETAQEMKTLISLVQK